MAPPPDRPSTSPGRSLRTRTASPTRSTPLLVRHCFASRSSSHSARLRRERRNCGTAPASPPVGASRARPDPDRLDSSPSSFATAARRPPRRTSGFRFRAAAAPSWRGQAASAPTASSRNGGRSPRQRSARRKRRTKRPPAPDAPDPRTVPREDAAVTAPCPLDACHGSAATADSPAHRIPFRRMIGHRHAPSLVDANPIAPIALKRRPSRSAGARLSPSSIRDALRPA